MELRQPTLKDVLTTIYEKTGLNFSIPEQSYSTTKVPHFKNLGDGYQAIKTIGRVFQIDDYIWQQQDSGVVYVGSWSDSRWPDRAAEIPTRFFNRQLSSQSAELATIPQLRPGALLNQKRLNSVELNGSFMVVTWSN